MSYRKFKIKKKIWSVKGHYQVFDEQDRLVYETRGNSWMQSNFSFTDASGSEIFHLRRKMLSLRHTFFLSNGSEELFKVFKTFKLKPEIFVENLIDPDAFYIEGNLWASEFRFFREEEEFAFVSKDIWKLADTYGVAIKDGREEALILALVIIINIIKDIQQARG